MWKLDRLARSLKQLINTADYLKGRGIGLVSLIDAIDTASPGGMLVFHMLGTIAEFERALMRERTTAGLAEARREGRVGGQLEREPSTPSASGSPSEPSSFRKGALHFRGASPSPKSPWYLA